MKSKALRVTVLRMIETTFKTTHAGAETRCDVASNVDAELAEQAELVAFAHFVARVFLLLGPARAGSIVDALVVSRDVDWAAVASPSETRTIVRFVDGASGPRLYFRLNARGKLYANVALDGLASGGQMSISGRGDVDPGPMGGTAECGSAVMINPKV